uniref:16S rRNA (uracil(1498)-N(3))-methyltransferase n=1 Tax=Tetraselmis chuii TaxID=63592 RepID=A0A7S1SV40_9CHLO|mmetsp:Transcript_31049/g.55600  ORF Transcript_31049/g.55600 Transcript_31049/m.55600 type:complete len:356 (+) Transcript_31049:173-1240(+)
MSSAGSIRSSQAELLFNAPRSKGRISTGVAHVRAPYRKAVVRCRNRILFAPHETGLLDSGVVNELRLRNDDGRAIHIKEILKLEAGDPVKIGILGGERGIGTVTHVSDSGVNVEFPTESREAPMDKLKIDLLLALPRPKVVNRLWPILSSLGIRSIYVSGAEKVEKAYWGAKCLHHEKILEEMVSGLEQAGDTVPPTVVSCRRLKKLLAWLQDEVDPRDEALKPGTADGDGIFVPKELVRGCLPASLGSGDRGKPLAVLRNEQQLRLVAHPGESAVSIREAVGAHMESNEGDHDSCSVLLAVGPEGGWTDPEVELLRSTGFVHVSLGSRPLTTSTAAVALISIVGDTLQFPAKPR